jgi:hypothetical protein
MTQESQQQKKPYETPVLIRYGTLKDVYKGPSCLGTLGGTTDK